MISLLAILSLIAITVNSQCAEVAVALQTINAPVFNDVLSGLANDQLTLGFNWGRTTTRTTTPLTYTGTCFLNPQPNSFNTGDACFSAFTTNSAFSSLTGNPACGLTNVAQGSPSSTVWRIPLTLAGNETFFDARNTLQNRQLVYPMLIQIGFPEFVTATVSLNVFAPVLLDAFIISQIYTASTGKATIVFNTVVGYPFNILLGVAQLSISQTEINGFQAIVTNNIPNTLATISGTNSKQTWVMEITPPANACTFTGNYNISGFIISCVNPADCPNINNNQAAVNLIIESENFCAQTSSVVGIVPTLAVYSNPTFTLPGGNFLVDDLPVQTAYFQMSVSSTSVSITGVQIATVVLSASSSVLYTEGTPTNAVTVYNNGSWIANINGAAGLAVVDPASARFRFDVVSALFNIPVDTAAQVLVQVTSKIDYLGAKKRSDGTFEKRSEYMTNEFLVELQPDDGEQKEVFSLAVGFKGPKATKPLPVSGEGSNLNYNMLFAITLGCVALLMVAVLVVLIVVIIRNRKPEEQTLTSQVDQKNDDLISLEIHSI